MFSLCSLTHTGAQRGEAVYVFYWRCRPRLTPRSALPQAKAVGSTYLGRRVRRLRPHMHIFGHTHFAWDAVHDGAWRRRLGGAALLWGLR